MNEYFSIIESASPGEARTVFVRCLKSCVAGLKEGEPAAVELSYQIAGLMATSYARTLEDSDPINEILTIAGELETHPSNTDELCQELIEKIQNL